MAIINASDLLVYLNFPSAIPQVTRIKCRTSDPLSGSSGTLTILKTTNASGTEVASITTGSSADTVNFTSATDVQLGALAVYTDAMSITTKKGATLSTLITFTND